MIDIRLFVLFLRFKYLLNSWIILMRLTKSRFQIDVLRRMSLCLLRSNVKVYNMFGFFTLYAYHLINPEIFDQCQNDHKTL